MKFLNLFFILSATLIQTGCSYKTEQQQATTYATGYIHKPDLALLEHLKPIKVHKKLTQEQRLWMLDKQLYVYEELMDNQGKVFYKDNIALHLKPMPTMMHHNMYCRVIQESLRIGVDEWVSDYMVCKNNHGKWTQVNVK